MTLTFGMRPLFTLAFGLSCGCNTSQSHGLALPAEAYGGKDRLVRALRGPGGRERPNPSREFGFRFDGRSSEHGHLTSPNDCVIL
jgi:hypothetical protein